MALFTESLPFWTSKKIDPTVVTPEVDSDQQVAALIINNMPVVVPLTLSKKPSMNNEEEIVELTDALEGAQSDSATTEMELSVSKSAIVLISIPEESLKNNAEEIDKVTESAEVIDATQGAQGAVKAKATKVAKAKSAGKKVAYQTSLGSSIAKNRPKRACTLKRTISGQPMVEALRKVSKDSSVPQKRKSDFSPKNNHG